MTNADREQHIVQPSAQYQQLPRMAVPLMQGPRGRRLLLEYAIASERLNDPEHRDDSFTAGVFLASYHLDPGKGTSTRLFGDVGAGIAVVTASEVAARLAAVPLAEVTPTLLRDCLSISVDMARYWQEPDGRDVLAATEEMNVPLQRVAKHLATSPHTGWWGERVAESSQWAIEWDGEPPSTRATDPISVLRVARQREIEEEHIARRERPKDPRANWSGNWWSRPDWELPSSAGELFDGSPAKLWFVEDSLGWQRAEVQRLGISPGLHVYEIDTAEAWAQLCARFPLDVTAQKRHDWFRTTGRVGSWVIPDWAKVAEHYDAVHLQVRAYLSAAGTSIAVDEHTASVIAGWAPDQTYWFTPNVRFQGERVTWAFAFSDGRAEWVRAGTDLDEGTSQADAMWTHFGPE